MSYYAIFVISAASILLPAGAAVLRLKRMRQRHLPLCILFGLGVVNEVTSFLLVSKGLSNMLNSNIYALLEYMLLVWSFRNLERKQSLFYLTALIAGIVVWSVDHFVLYSVHADTTLFRFWCFVVVVYMCIAQVTNSLIATSEMNVDRGEITLCIGFFLFFSFQGFLVVFNMFPLGVDEAFYVQLWLVNAVINVLANFLLMIGVLWIPTHALYTIRY